MGQAGIATRILAAASLALVLAGCAGAPERPDFPADGPVSAADSALLDPVRSRIIFTALQMVGVRYVYGGESPAGFDCSGLVQYAYGSAGVPVPRTSRQQLRASTPVPLADAHPGDLLFFQSTDNSHVGIYLGQGRFVHAPATGRTVSIASFSDGYYRRNFVRAGRLLAM